MPFFVPIGLEFSTRVGKRFSAQDVLYETSLNILNGAQHFDLVTFHRESIASKQAQLFDVYSFGGALNYSLLAMVFATRPAIFCFDPSTASTAFLRYRVIKASAGV